MTGSDGDGARGERFERREFHSYTFHGGGEKRRRKKSTGCFKGHRFETASVGGNGPYWAFSVFSARLCYLSNTKQNILLLTECKVQSNKNYQLNLNRWFTR